VRYSEERIERKKRCNYAYNGWVNPMNEDIGAAANADVWACR
jgi:hypothetical protein